MKQQFCGRYRIGVSGFTFHPPNVSGDIGSIGTFTQAQAEVIQLQPGTYRNLRGRLTATVTSGHTYQAILYKKVPAGSYVSTGLTITITNADGTNIITDSSNEAHFDAGDKVLMSWEGAPSPAANTVIWSLEFEPDVADTSIYGCGGPAVTLPTGSSVIEGAFSGGTFDAENGDIVAVPGTITGQNLNLSTAPGVGKSREVVLVLNSVVQDGSGATVDTRCTVSGTAVDNTSAFSLPVVVGDRVARQHTPTGTPAASFGNGQVSFVSDVPNSWNVCGRCNAGSPSNAATNYGAAFGDMFSSTWSATESVYEYDAPVTSFQLSGFRWITKIAPGGTDQWDLALRVNGVTTAQAVAIIGTDLDETTTGDAASIADGDTFSMQSVPTSTPTSMSKAWWSFAGSTEAAEIKGSFVAGADGTVTSSRTALFNLDGVTRTVHAPNTLYVAGYFTLHEGGSPTPIANTAILFAKDTGGKTELLVQFPTGSAIQIAIEA